MKGTRGALYDCQLLEHHDRDQRLAHRTTFRPPNHRPARTAIHCLLTTRIEIPILLSLR